MRILGKRLISFQSDIYTHSSIFSIICHVGWKGRICHKLKEPTDFIWTHRKKTPSVFFPTPWICWKWFLLRTTVNHHFSPAFWDNMFEPFSRHLPQANPSNDCYLKNETSHYKKWIGSILTTIEPKLPSSLVFQGVWKLQRQEVLGVQTPILKRYLED